jgi:ATP-binding cassette subfamily F protein 3
MALNEFEGTVMLVSHDRALLRAVCDEFWLVGRGGIQPFDGDLDDYQQYLLDEAKRLRELARKQGAPIAAPAPAPAPQAQRKQDAQERQQAAAKAKPLKRELDQAEKRMAELNGDKGSLEAKLAAPLPAPELADAGRRLKAVNEELQKLEERWLELTEQIDNMA